MSQGTFSDTLINLEAFNRIFVVNQKIDFSPGFLVKIEQILMSGFFAPLCP